MSHTLFISDLHLCDSRPHIKQLFQRFLQETAAQAEALYILGDLFEYWAGDDDLDDPRHRAVVEAMAGLSASGVRLYLMHGNRDFLLSATFAQACGATLLPDPTLLELYGRRVLLTHGDALCTDDVEYQQFRRQARDPAYQQAFLEQPLAARKAQIEALRTRSEQAKSYKSESIMDVNADAVNELLRRHDYPELLIHGHTHRPGVHDVAVDGHACQRWVLGDWFDSGNSLRCGHAGCAWQAT
jgi:UDP-2,3-diacylglucosamine hydrolase